MSQESLEQFMEKVGSNEELRASIENQLDSDGNISVGALITLGAENGCEFNTEDLTQNLELSDEELDGVAGGVAILGQANGVAILGQANGVKFRIGREKTAKQFGGSGHPPRD